MACDALDVLIGRLGPLSHWPGLNQIREYCYMALRREVEVRLPSEPEFWERIRRLVLVWLILDIYSNSCGSQLWDVIGEPAGDWLDVGIDDPFFAALIRSWGYGPTDLTRAGFNQDNLRLYLTGDKPPCHLRTILAATERKKNSDK